MKSKFFKLEEWFSQKMFEGVMKRFGRSRAEAILWGLLDPRIIEAADFFRFTFGATVINNWHVGGKFQQSGFRDDPGVGAEFSCHLFGRGVDLKNGFVAPEEFRERVRKNPALWIDHGVTEIEEGTPTWNHLGCRNHNNGGLLWLPKP